MKATSHAILTAILLTPALSQAQTTTCNPTTTPLCNLATTLAAPPVAAAAISITPHASWKNRVEANDDFYVTDLTDFDADVGGLYDEDGDGRLTELLNHLF